MVWPNAGLVIAISVFGIRKGFRLRGKIDMQRTQSQFQALQKFVNRTFFTAVCCLLLCSQLMLVCWNHARNVGDRATSAPR
jgi:hypothetical protein